MSVIRYKKAAEYRPREVRYGIATRGKPYANLVFPAENRHDETLRRKTFAFPPNPQKEKLLKDQGLKGALIFLRKNGVRNIEIAELSYKTQDGQNSVKLIYAEPPRSAALAPRAVDVFLHGRNTGIGYLSVPAIQSYFNGKAICLLSYRGEEGNQGTPYQEALADDLDACIEFLQQHKKWESSRINFVASSLGCDILSNMLYRRSTVHSKPEEQFGNATMIAPFSSLYDIAKVSIGRYRLIPRQEEPSTPGLLYPFRKLIAKLFKKPILSLFDNLPYLARQIQSVKIFASKGDEYIPLEQTRQVYQRLIELMGQDRVKLKEFPDLSHSQLCESVT